jgi:hypothetical protein
VGAERRISARARAERRRLNASLRAEHRRPPPTHDEIVALNRSRMPKRLSADQFDAEQGSLRWPAVLRRPQFEELRSELDGLFVERALYPYDAGQGSRNLHDVEHLTREFRRRLQAIIHELSGDEFITGNRFLKSLAYEARFGSGSKPEETSGTAGIGYESPCVRAPGA